MKSIILFCLLFGITFSVSPQILPQLFPPRKITLHASPVDAVIYEVIPSSKELKQMGIGIAVIEVPKNIAKTIVLRRSGFADVSKLYSTMVGAKLPKEDFLTMRDRQVAVKVWPTDAKVTANGVEVEQVPINILVKEGEKINVEVKKAGFSPVKRTYANLPGTDPPPVNEEIKLRDRVIQVVATPSDASILADNLPIGTGQGDVIVPFDHCVVVKVTKPGFYGTEKSFCNKEGIPDLPAKETLSLVDRAVVVKIIPNDADIKVNGKLTGKGEINLKVAKGECVELIAEKVGFSSVQKNYCNQDNSPEMSASDSIKLIPDETITLSCEANFVNINNIIDIKSNKNETDAWKSMSKVVMNYFDILEISDIGTGYLRTGWVSVSLPGNTIRTRLIVKAADSNTPKYVVKLISEASGKSGSNINDDKSFSEWNRVLLKYKDIISDIQSRLN